jgi:hypothetical protein
VIVAAASYNGLSGGVHAVLPSGGSLPDLWQFLQLGAATVPVGIVASTMLLWSMIKAGV